MDEVESENEDEDEDEDVFDGPVTATTTTAKVVNVEHSDPNSYSWLVLKLAVLRICQNRLQDFLAVSTLTVYVNKC